MDNEKFGKFISTLRKRKGWTQSELAEKLSVTDKAVSKWERGKGFPDISTLKPLADALDVSLLEIMQTEELEKEEMPAKKASEALINTISIAKHQQEIERKNIIIGITLVTTFILLIFLVDILHWETFFFVCLPLIFFAIGVLLISLSIYQRRHHRPYSITLLFGILSMLCPLTICLLLFFAFAFGGLVQN